MRLALAFLFLGKDRESFSVRCCWECMRAGRLCYMGNTGTGFSDLMLKEVYGRLKPYFTDTCPFTPRPKANAPVQWVKPRGLFARWRSRNGLRTAKMRAPNFLGLRDDKEPKESSVLSSLHSMTSFARSSEIRFTAVNFEPPNR